MHYLVPIALYPEKCYNDSYSIPRPIVHRVTGKRQNSRRYIVEGYVIFAIVMVVVVAILVALYFAGRKLEKRNAAQQEQLAAAAQNVSMLVIDKKRMKLKEAGLPAIVLEQTPWYLRRSKLPIVKAKIGPKVMSLICDEKIFDLIPVKKEVKAVVSGLYITSVKNVRGSLEAPKKKKNFFARMTDKLTKKDK